MSPAGCAHSGSCPESGGACQRKEAEGGFSSKILGNIYPTSGDTGAQLQAVAFGSVERNRGLD